jgi:hypothetical protein
MPGKYSGNVTVSHPDVPYYSQWESPELVGRFLDGSLRAADDPRWAASGAATPDEYAFWARRVCGLACLKMLLAWQGEPVPTSMALVRRALACGAYVRDGDRVRGLIYQPFVAWIGAEYGIAAQVMRELPVSRSSGTPGRERWWSRRFTRGCAGRSASLRPVVATLCW